MRIETKGRVAIAAILDIAINGTNHPVRLADISKRQGVSQSYLEQLFRTLVRDGIVASVRGPGGGYRLIRHMAAVSVGDVIAAVDTEVLGRDDAEVRSSEDVGAVAGELWSGLDDCLRDYLRSVTLASILAGATESIDQKARLDDLVRQAERSRTWRTITADFRSVS